MTMFVYLLEFPGRNPVVYKSFRDATQGAEFAMWNSDYKHWNDNKSVDDPSRWHKCSVSIASYWTRPIVYYGEVIDAAKIQQLEVKEFGWSTPVKDARELTNREQKETTT